MALLYLEGDGAQLNFPLADYLDPSTGGFRRNLPWRVPAGALSAYELVTAGGAAAAARCERGMAAAWHASGLASTALLGLSGRSDGLLREARVAVEARASQGASITGRRSDAGTGRRSKRRRVQGEEDWEDESNTTTDASETPVLPDSGSA
jgi:hypothetical protein